jgi:hypothetical protein
MRLSIGALQVTIKYTYQRVRPRSTSAPFPPICKARYPGATIKQDLKTADPLKVARMVSALNDKLEAEWSCSRVFTKGVKRPTQTLS